MAPPSRFALLADELMAIPGEKRLLQKSFADHMDDVFLELYEKRIFLTAKEATSFFNLVDEFLNLFESSDAARYLSSYKSVLISCKEKEFFDCELQQLEKEFLTWVERHADETVEALYARYFPLGVTFFVDPNGSRLRELARHYSRLTDIAMGEVLDEAFFQEITNTKNTLIEIMGSANFYRDELSKLEFHYDYSPKHQPFSTAFSILKRAIKDFAEATIEPSSHNKEGGLMNINVHGDVGLLNTGEIKMVKTLSANLTKLNRKEGYSDFVKAMGELIEAVSKSQELASSQREEALEQLQELQKQASLPSEKRSKGIVKALLVGLAQTLSAAGGAAKVWETWGSNIRQFFGI